MISASDLAASGSKPLGLLLSDQWAFGVSKATQASFFRGVKAAMKKSKVPLLGGDSGFAAGDVHTSTALGISTTKPLTRIGAKPGDYVCLLGKNKLGEGPSLAFRFLFQHPERFFPEKLYRPEPAPWKTHKIRALARASIDTSDGLATSFDIISEVNNVGFELVWRDHFASVRALKFCEKSKLHPLMLWMGDHGDFQTMLFIPKANIDKAMKLEKDLMILGRVTKRKNHTTVDFKNKIIELPVRKVTACPRDLKAITKLAHEVNQFFFKSLADNKPFNSHKSPTREAIKPAQRIKPKVRGDRK